MWRGTSRSCRVRAAYRRRPRAYSVNVTVVPKGDTVVRDDGARGAAVALRLDAERLCRARVFRWRMRRLCRREPPGALTFLGSQDTDLIVDINGYFAAPAAGGLNFYPVRAVPGGGHTRSDGPLGGPIIPGYAVPARSFPLAAERRAGCRLRRERIR